jgi:hypothetical protein
MPREYLIKKGEKNMLLTQALAETRQEFIVHTPLEIQTEINDSLISI